MSSTSQTNTLALVSFVAGILSWVLPIPFIAALVAVVTGHMARQEIRGSLGTQEGSAFALIGLILGYAHVLVICVSIVVGILFFGGVIGLTGCAILSESVGYIVTGDTLSLLSSY